MSAVQFNFELPEAEASRLLDVGVARKMGLTRDTVQKAMIARALVIERLDQIAPRAADLPAINERLAKLQVALAANPALGPELDRLLARATRARRTKPSPVAA